MTANSRSVPWRRRFRPPKSISLNTMGRQRAAPSIALFAPCWICKSDGGVARRVERVFRRNHFLTEAACEDYLKRRFDKGCYRCPRCGSRRGHYIPSRRCWECSGCKRQTGLRAGTVAADSPLPLVVWFAAIRLLLWQPTVGTAELRIKLGISRSTTVRQLAHKIRAAMAEENASELLAGLDIHYAPYRTTLAESGVPGNKNTVSGSGGIQEPSGAAVSLMEMEG